jgi:hypothetical protein
MLSLTTLVLVAAANCSASAPATRVRASFPGALESVASPNAKYSLRWVVGHRLLLCDRRLGVESELLAFPRAVSVLWSPSGRHLAVSNHWASDEATVLVWTQLPGVSIDLLEQLASQEQQGAARWDAHHIYLDACAWDSDTSLRLHLWGYGDPALPTIDRWYRYELGKGFARIEEKRRSRTSGCS